MSPVDGDLVDGDVQEREEALEFRPARMEYTRLVIPPGVNPESLVVYSSVEGQE